MTTEKSTLSSSWCEKTCFSASWWRPRSWPWDIPTAPRLRPKVSIPLSFLPSFLCDLRKKNSFLKTRPTKWLAVRCHIWQQAAEILQNLVVLFCEVFGQRASKAALIDLYFKAILTVFFAFIILVIFATSASWGSQGQCWDLWPLTYPNFNIIWFISIWNLFICCLGPMVSAVCRQVLIKQKSRRILFFCAYWKLSYSFDVVHSLKKKPKTSLSL